LRLRQKPLTNVHCGLSTASDAAAATSWSLVLYHHQDSSPLLTAALISLYFSVLLLFSSSLLPFLFFFSKLLLSAWGYLSHALSFSSRIFASRYFSLPRSIPSIKISSAPPSSFFPSSQLRSRTAFAAPHRFSATIIWEASLCYRHFDRSPAALSRFVFIDIKHL
jgi:hypothetical protein